MPQWLNNFFGWIVVRIPDVFAQFITLGDGRIGKWYHTNQYFRFKVGDAIQLKSPRYFGYGIRPVGKVTGYKTHNRHERREDLYVIEMESDIGDHYFEWADEGKIPPDVKRKTEIQVHFKWNIDYTFVKVAAKDGLHCRLTNTINSLFHGFFLFFQRRSFR